MNTTCFESELDARYAAIQGLDCTGPMTLLHIGAEHTGLAMGIGPEIQSRFVFAIGSDGIAREHLRHQPPTALELEHAIFTVEEEVMPGYRSLPPGSTLYSSDASIRVIASLAGVSHAAVMRLSVESVEQIFNRLAFVVGGRPASVERLPENNQFASTLLILRELMHHLGFSSITIVDLADLAGFPDPVFDKQVPQPGLSEVERHCMDVTQLPQKENGL